MKENIKSIKSLPDYEKIVYSFDKKGNRFEKKVKVDDNYLVTMKDGSSVCLTKKQLSYYGVNCVLPNNEVIESSTQINDDIVEDDLNNENESTITTQNQLGSPNIVENF